MKPCLGLSYFTTTNKALFEKLMFRESIRKNDLKIQEKALFKVLETNMVYFYWFSQK